VSVAELSLFEPSEAGDADTRISGAGSKTGL